MSGGAAAGLSFHMIAAVLHYLHLPSELLHLRYIESCVLHLLSALLVTRTSFYLLGVSALWCLDCLIGSGDFLYFRTYRNKAGGGVIG